jgi:formylglycine-generating enzyme
MSSESDFLQAILAHPDDVSARVVFADWLEEQGDPRGELLRLLHTLTQSVSVADRGSLEEHLRNLLAAGVKPVGPVRTNSLGMELVLLPPGVFNMGSSKREKGHRSDENQVAVTLTRGFWIGKYPVTQGQWTQLMGSTVREQGARSAAPSRYPGEGPNFPMYYVSHTDASEFCRRLTEQERSASQLMPDWEYRLPTEAQWEYACRAGTESATPFGDSLSDHQANFNGKEAYNAPKGKWLGQTTEVGSYPANGWGLHDMLGNVVEWCRDWYAEKRKGGIDPKGSDGAGRVLRNGDIMDAGLKVLRGGCYQTPGVACRSASRSWSEPGFSDNLGGFRVVLEVSAE